jgi:hypothetical protein
MKTIHRCMSSLSLAFLFAVTALAEGEHPVANSGQSVLDNAKPAKNSDSAEKHAPITKGKTGNAKAPASSGKGTTVGESMPLDAPDLRAHATADPHLVKSFHPITSLIGKTGKMAAAPPPKSVFSTPAAAAAVHSVKSMPALPGPPMASAEAASIKKVASLPARPMAVSESAALLKAGSPRVNSFSPLAPVSPAPVSREQKPVGETAFYHPGAPLSLRPGSALSGTPATLRGRASALAVIGGSHAGNGSKTMKSTASINGSAIR